MTTPSEPPPRFNPQQYGYGQPTPPQQPPQRPQGQQQFPTGPQPQVPQQGAAPSPYGPGGTGEHVVPQVKRKGFFGALLDTSFDAMVTPMLIRGFYMLSLTVITVFSIGLFLFIWGLGGNDPYSDPPKWPLFTAIVVTPLFWTFQVLVVRMTLEFVINQFKITEELKKLNRK